MGEAFLDTHRIFEASSYRLAGSETSDKTSGILHRLRTSWLQIQRECQENGGRVPIVDTAHGKCRVIFAKDSMNWPEE